MTNKNKANKGFTLLELLIVVAIIGLLIAIAIPTFQGILNRARDTTIRSSLEGISTATAQYEIEYGNLTGFCASPFVAEVKSTIQGTGIDAKYITCIEAPDFVIMSSALHTGGGWVVDSTGHTGMEASRIGLVGEWKFEGNALDASGLGNDGTLLPVASPPIFVDGALSFDGVNDFVRVPDAASLQLVSAGTVEIWVRFNSFTEMSGIFSKTDMFGAWADNDYGIVQHPAGHLRAMIGNGITANSVLTPPLSLNTWYHVVFLWDGSMLRLFLNGIQVTSLSQTITPRVTTDPVLIGPWGGGPPLDGLINEVRIYNRALSAAEIKAQFEAGR